MIPDTENQGAPDAEPLNAEERRLARLLGQLPGSMPSPDTDRRILAAAERSEPPKAHGNWRWGIGGAIAAGLALVMFWPEPSPTPPPTEFDQVTVPATAEDATKPNAPPQASAMVADAESLGEANASAAASVETTVSSRQRSAVESMPLESDLDLAPELWLVRIQDRLDAGQREQAMRSLSLFVQRYPEHPLPETLDELIR